MPHRLLPRRGRGTARRAVEGAARAGAIQRLVRFATLCTLLLAAAAGLSAAVFAATEKAPAALVFGLRAMPDGTSLLGLDGPVAIVAGEPGYVRRLYAAGAVLVLPFRKNGCLGTADQRLASVAMRSASAASTVPISQR